MSDPDALRALATRLKALVQLSPKRPEELDRWQQAVEAFRRYLASDHAAADVPHFVWHYLSDADIRLKDADYRAADDKTIQGVIAALERSELPAQEDSDWTLWAGVVAFEILLLLYATFS